MTQHKQALEGATHRARNRLDRLEWAGALGDLGTLIPFTVAYITLLNMDPFGVLFAFGVAQIIAGLYYKTPFPVQPMKAIGAGGMAGHVRFGMRTGGALLILGTLLTLLALFLSGSIETLFKIFPLPVLGLTLFLTGTQLALGAGDGDDSKEARFVRYATAAFAMWNTGAAFLFGIALYHLLKKGWVRP